MLFFDTFCAKNLHTWRKKTTFVRHFRRTFKLSHFPAMGKVGFYV